MYSNGGVEAVETKAMLTKEEAAAIEAKLGKNQKYALQALRSPRHGSQWYPGCGWIWDNCSTTIRLLDSLVVRGLATKLMTKPSWAAGREIPRYKPVPVEGVEWKNYS